VAGPREYTAGTRAALATLSKGHCYYPGCTVPTIVFIEGEPVINYQIAHIRDAKPGNRYVAHMTEDERRSFKNLVLLCKPHHDYVDRQKPELFSINTLQEWKESRESAAVAELRGLDGLTEEKLAEMIRDAVAAGSTRSPLLDWTVDEDQFENDVAHVLRSSDDITLRRFLERADKEWRGLIDEKVGSVAEALRLLDRLTCLAAYDIRWNRSEWASTVVDTLASMYSAVLSEHGAIRPRLVEPGHRLLMAILDRVLGLGTVAVDVGAWRLINDFALRTPDRMSETYTNWIRHTTTSASRAGALQYTDSAGRTVRSSYLEIALFDIGGLRCLNPDAPDKDQFRSRLAGFDALATISAWYHAPGDGDDPHFPWHRAYEGDRYENAIALVLTNPEVREVVFPGNDQSLAQLLLRLEQFGIREMSRFGGGWRYVHPTIQVFVAPERERQHREQLLDTVRGQAQRTGSRLPVSRRGQKPTIVTYTTGETQAFVADLETYKRLASSGVIDPRTAAFGRPPRLLSEWNAEELQAWLDQSLDQ
jgi:hypothetical protein